MGAYGGPCAINDTHRSFKLQKAFYNISEMAAMLGLTVASIQAHLYRKNYEAVPPPVHLGRRLAWPVETTEAWVRLRTESVLSRFPAPENIKRRVGRPTKAESRARRQKLGLK
jgi:predicted DNA-binding transcriptional regulator AlpA